MRRTAILIILSAFSLACQKASVDKKGDLLGYKESALLNDIPRSTITFFEVSDSRCPEGVQCFWAGNAIVDFSLEGVGTEGKITKHVNMCLGDCRTLYKSATFRETDSLNVEFAGQQFIFILEAVNPQPRPDSIRKKEAYSVSLRIEKK